MSASAATPGDTRSPGRRLDSVAPRSYSRNVRTKEAQGRRNELGEVDYRCSRDHRVYGENVEWRKNGKGKSHPGCRQCRREYVNRYSQRPDVKARAKKYERIRPKISTAPAYNSRGEEIPLEEYLGAEKRSVPWNLLRPRPEASSVFDEFNEALKVTNVPCRGRAAEFTEYSDPRAAYASDNEGRAPMPTKSQATAMCASCPLLELCGDYAAIERPDFGVHAGNRWVNGKVV